MINFPPRYADARNRPSGENDSGCTELECCLRLLVFFFASGVQMTILPLSNPLNENERKMKYVPLPLRPLRAGEKKGNDNLFLQWPREKMFASEKVRKQKLRGKQNQGIRFEANIKKWIQSFLFVQSHFSKTLICPLLNSPN
jgi:hypothetical protein